MAKIRKPCAKSALPSAPQIQRRRRPVLPREAALGASRPLTIPGPVPNRADLADIRRFRLRAPNPGLEASGANMGVVQRIRIAGPARRSYAERNKRLRSMGRQLSCGIFRSRVGVARNTTCVRYDMRASQVPRTTWG